MQLTLDIALLTLKFRSALARLGAEQYVCEELAQGPYTLTVSDEDRTRTLRATQILESHRLKPLRNINNTGAT